MAVTGIFNADFGSFFTAVEQSEIKLKSMESAAATVEGRMGKMADSFSGQKIIGEASMMARIFEEAGGAAAFTEKEMQRMGSTAREAVEKMEALGQDVPDGIRKIAEETKGAAKETESWTGSIGKVALGFVSMQTAMAGWNFIKDVVAAGAAIEDLASELQISSEELQIMGESVEDFGVDMEEMGRAVFKLSRNIAKGDDSISDALLTMGLSLQQVKDMRGEELFRTIQEALGKLDGSLRDTVAAELYGEKLAASMGAAAAGAGDALDKARAHGDYMKGEHTAAMKAAALEVDNLKDKLMVLASTIIGPVAKGVNDFIAVADKAGVSAAAWARVKDAFFEVVGKEKTAFDQLATSVGVDTAAKDANAGATNNAAAAGDNNTRSLNDQTGATKRLREEEALRKAAAAGLADFEQITRVHLADQARIDESIAKTREEQQVKNEAHAAKLQAGAAYMTQVGEIAKVNREAAEFEKGLATEQKALDESNKALIESFGEMETAHTDAGAAAEAAGEQTVAAYAGISQQIELTSDGVRGWIELMQYTAAANAILSQNSLYTSGSQYEAIARLGTPFSGVPGFAGGIQNFAGGVAKVHGGETLVNLPGGTSVIPAGGGGGVINNTFHLTDTESNLARRVSEEIMRTIRAGTQLGTA